MSMCNENYERCSCQHLKDRIASLEKDAARYQWLPIETAPDDVLVVVGWLDDEDREHPERYDFDYKEEGGWVGHADNVEHAQMVAPPGSRMPKERAPYMLWLSIPCLQASIAAQKGGAA